MRVFYAQNVIGIQLVEPSLLILWNNLPPINWQIDFNFAVHSSGSCRKKRITWGKLCC